ncbi:MAG: RIP metalloprotease RseP [Bacteroidales bacterium]|nr:RIP metalloprotease RseP [Bacteroidales bacterium]
MKILQVVLALSLLIIIHEAGHFTFAKLFGVKVDKFYLFFDAGGFRLFSTRNNRLLCRLFPKLKDAETDYGIGWLPLGGYCKISGMVDESMDTEYLNQDPQPWEFRTRPAWQRFLVMAGGVLYNFVFAVLLYIAIMAIWGEVWVSNENADIYVNDLSYEMGFRTGDHIVSFDNWTPEDFNMLQADFVRRETRKAVVLRDSDTVELYIDQSYLPKVLETPGMFELALPFIVDSVVSANAEAGLMKGDRIFRIDSTEVRYMQESRELLAACAGGEVDVCVEREGDTVCLNLAVDSLGKLGIYTYYPATLRTYSLFKAIPAGLRHAWESVSGYLRDMKLVFTPRTEAYKSVGSFIAIGSIFPSAWNWYQFINILAMLSVMLGVMNLIPIPGLDGGHMVFIMYEMITGRKPSDRFMMVMQYIGLFLLLALMVFACGNDIGRLMR